MTLPKKPLPYIVFALCAAIYFVPFLRVLSHSGDEGELINDALRVVQGQLPFRDFFEGMGPGTYYWLAFYFKLFGATWLATRISLLATTVAIATVLFYLARRLDCRSAAAPVVFFVAVSYHSWNVVSHHMDSNLFGLLSFVALLWWIDQRSGFVLFVAGLGAGVTTCFLQQKGVCLFLAFLAIAWIAARKYKPLGVLAAGYAVPGAATLAWFWVKGGLPDLIYANLTWPLTTYSAVNSVPYGLGLKELYWDAWTKSLVPALSATVGYPISVMLSAPFAAVLTLPVLLIFLAFRERRRAFQSATMPYWIAGSALWLSEMPRKDLAHVAYGSPILIVLAFYLCDGLRGRLSTKALRAVVACAAAVALVNPLVALLTAHRTITRRGAVYNAFASDPVLDFIDQHVKPGEPVFVYPYSPMYYFLSAAQNPTRFNFLLYHQHTDAHFREVVESLERRQVRYVVWDRAFPERARVWFPEWRQPPPSRQIVEPYLASHYIVVGETSAGYEFLERVPTDSARLHPVSAP